MSDKKRNLITLIAIGNLLDDSGQTAEDVGFTEDEQARVVEIIERDFVGDVISPDDLATAKQMFREALDAVLADA